MVPCPRLYLYWELKQQSSQPLIDNLKFYRDCMSTWLQAQSIGRPTANPSEILAKLVCTCLGEKTGNYSQPNFTPGSNTVICPPNPNYFL